MKKEGLVVIGILTILVLAGFALAEKNNSVKNCIKYNAPVCLSGSHAQVVQPDENGCYPAAECVLDNDNKERTGKAVKIEFIAWQKKTDSECLAGCKCAGAVMSCPTDSGKMMTIQAGSSGKTIVIEVNNAKADTDLNISIEDNNKTKLKVNEKE